MASTLDVFDFAIVKEPKPFESYKPALRRINSSRTGKKFVLVKGDVLEFQAKVTTAFPQPPTANKDLSDMIAFADDHKALAFLYMPFMGPSLRQETITAVTDGTTDTWAFNHKYIDESSVKVYLDGVEQTGNWTLINNNSAPAVKFTSPPATSKTLLIVANFFVPVVFRKNPLEAGTNITDSKIVDEDAPQSFAFEMVETEPGARWVNATGMSGA
jgi:hypothetical protein